MEFAEILAQKGLEAGLKFSELQLQQFTRYYEMLVETNKVMNLTAITEPEEVAVKHMILCWLMSPLCREVRCLLMLVLVPDFPVCRSKYIVRLLK